MTEGKKAVVPPTGDYNSWYSKFVLPQGLEGKISAAGWTKGNEGFIQQTFLGASIISFNVTAGFGDTTSTLSADLINDEYNKSDGTGIGLGDDVYHNGQQDMFVPPPVGSPVFFKFGKNFADIEQAWRKTFDDTYGYSTLEKIITTEKIFNSFDEVPPYHFYNLEKSKQTNQLYFEDKSDYYDISKNHPGRGANHFIFGGILQSYIQNKSPNGNPLYTVQIADPREILSNCSVILKNYAGTVFGNKNYFNVFGFLEHDISDELRQKFNLKNKPGFSFGPIATKDNWITQYPFPGVPAKITNNLEKVVDPNTGNIYYYGNDMYRFEDETTSLMSEDRLPEFFPMTGQGFARICDQGIPWYRVRQALEALFNYNGFLPKEYIDAGYGGPINFRGFNYVVDFGGIPLEKMPQMYFIDYEKIDLLSLAQEICETISHDMFVSLLPIIDHPACKFLYDYNKYWIREALEFDEGTEERNLRLGKVVTGIIRIDAINRSDAPAPGSIKSYLEELESKGIYVKNQDLGYELSNVETDKMIAGAQEVEMYFFNTSKDKDNLQLRRKNAGMDNGTEYLMGAQWSLDTMLKQQILPFYGFLGKDAPTIPRGFGAYQQIMLDATGLDAYGVGNYYIATEIELRASLISYERWRDFLLQYNNTYIEEFTNNQALLSVLNSKAIDLVPGITATLNKYGMSGVNWANRDFGVSVPRCVFNSDKDYMGEDGFPASRCAPPYGYPLYYQRASAIGIPEAGYAGVQASFDQLLISLPDDEKKLSNFVAVSKEVGIEIDRQIANYDRELAQDQSKKDKINEAVAILKKEQENIQNLIAQETERIGYIQEFVKTNGQLYKNIQRTGKKTMKNARKVYDFVKGIAEKHLGKTFLVKIPKACNVLYQKNIELWNPEDVTFNIKRGPFGFKPQTITSNIGYYIDNGYEQDVNLFKIRATLSEADFFEHYIYHPFGFYHTIGALKNNFNPISDKWEFNYEPEPQGGFFNFSLYNDNIPFGKIQEYNLDGSKLPQATLNLLAPRDLTNFIENGRIQCYVRFNDSQNLDLSQMPRESFSQQAYSEEGFIPDILEEFDNVSFDAKESFNQQGELFDLNQQRTVAFIKCSIDPKFYMPPKVVNTLTKVWGRKVRYVPNFGALKIIETRDQNGCLQKIPVKPYHRPIFWIENGGHDGLQIENTDFLRYYDDYTDSYLVDTDIENLDPENVYAVITLPGVVTSNVQTRYRDSVLSAANITKFYNLMTVDVVKGVNGFDQPPEKHGKRIAFDCNTNIADFRLSDLVSAFEVHRNTLRGLALDSPHIKVSYVAPSPVYPDIVALPLMSKERCYGPWLSTAVANTTGDTRLRYSNIGGKVDFVKDENLAPWNYGGYQLMNEAGALQAQFSNSLLLFTERGGFVIPDAPMGVSLAKTLKDNGPLVTSISVDVSNNEINTTIKLDLYTSRFGKLQKQKEQAIGFINRERQKIIDRTNADIRRGMGKNRSNASATQLFMTAGGATLQAIVNQQQTFYSNLEKGIEPVGKFLIQAEERLSEYSSLGGVSQNVSETITNINGIMTRNSEVMETMSIQPSEEEADKQTQNSVIFNPGEIMIPVARIASSNGQIIPSLQDNVSAQIVNERMTG